MDETSHMGERFWRDWWDYDALRETWHLLNQQCSLLRRENALKLPTCLFLWEKEPFICGIFMLLSFSFRDLVILTKFCQTRSIGSPDAFFQFPLKCFQQRLPFLLLKNTLQRWKKLQKKEQIIHCQWHWQSTGSPKNLLALTRQSEWVSDVYSYRFNIPKRTVLNDPDESFDFSLTIQTKLFAYVVQDYLFSNNLVHSIQAQLECFVWQAEPKRGP